MYGRWLTEKNEIFIGNFVNLQDCGQYYIIKIEDNNTKNDLDIIRTYKK